MKRYFLLFVFALGTIFGKGIDFSEKELNKNFKFFSLSANKNLAQDIANNLGIELGKLDLGKYNDGEIKIQILENIRGKDVYILQSICSSEDNSVNDNLMELFLMVRACKRAYANKIILIIPYFGYARMDRKVQDRTPISASDIAMILENIGVDQIVSLDLHSPQIQGFFRNITIENLMPSVIFAPYFERKKMNNLVVAAHDYAIHRSRSLIGIFTQYDITSKLAILTKYRSKPGVIDKMCLVGDVKGADVVMIDDICDTGSTLVESAKELKLKGANKIYACITHPVLSKNALERIKNSDIDEVIILDTIQIKEDIPSKMVQLSAAPLIADAIKRLQNNDSLSNLFNN